MKKAKRQVLSRQRRRHQRLLFSVLFFALLFTGTVVWLVNQMGAPDDAAAATNVNTGADNTALTVYTTPTYGVTSGTQTMPAPSGTINSHSYNITSSSTMTYSPASDLTAVAGGTGSYTSSGGTTITGNGSSATVSNVNGQAVYAIITNDTYTGGNVAANAAQINGSVVYQGLATGSITLSAGNAYRVTYYAFTEQGISDLNKSGYTVAAFIQSPTNASADLVEISEQLYVLDYTSNFAITPIFTYMNGTTTGQPAVYNYSGISAIGTNGVVPYWDMGVINGNGSTAAGFVGASGNIGKIITNQIGYTNSTQPTYNAVKQTINSFAVVPLTSTGASGAKVSAANAFVGANVLSGPWGATATQNTPTTVTTITGANSSFSPATYFGGVEDLTGQVHTNVYDIINGQPIYTSIEVSTLPAGFVSANPSVTTANLAKDSETGMYILYTNNPNISLSSTGTQALPSTLPTPSTTGDTYDAVYTISDGNGGYIKNASTNGSAPQPFTVQDYTALETGNEDTIDYEKTLPTQTYTASTELVAGGLHNSSQNGLGADGTTATVNDVNGYPVQVAIQAYNNDGSLATSTTGAPVYTYSGNASTVLNSTQLLAGHKYLEYFLAVTAAGATAYKTYQAANAGSSIIQFYNSLSKATQAVDFAQNTTTLTITDDTSVSAYVFTDSGKTNYAAWLAAGLSGYPQTVSGFYAYLIANPTDTTYGTIATDFNQNTSSWSTTPINDLPGQTVGTGLDVTNIAQIQNADGTQGSPQAINVGNNGSSATTPRSSYMTMAVTAENVSVPSMNGQVVYAVTAYGNDTTIGANTSYGIGVGTGSDGSYLVIASSTTPAGTSVTLPNGSQVELMVILPAEA